MTSDDIARMEKLAERLSQALYYQTFDAIGGGKLSTGLQHDDYDFLRRVAKEAKIANLKAELAELEADHRP